MTHRAERVPAHPPWYGITFEHGLSSKIDLGIGVLVPKCGYKPEGYEACTLDLGHEGECKCKLVDLFAVTVDLSAVAPDLGSSKEALETLFWEKIEGMFGKRGHA